MKHKPGRRQTLLLVGLYAALAAAWTWRLSPLPVAAGPHAATARENDAAQQHQARLSATAAWLARAPKHTAMPALMRLACLPEGDVHALAAWIRQPPLTQLRQLTVQTSPVAALGREWNEALLYTWLGHHPQVSLLDAHLMVAAAGDRLTDNTRLEVLSAMAAEAILRNESATAANILARACELPGATWEMQKQLAAAGRSARQFPPVLRALGLWISHEKDPERLQEALDIELSLMLDADLPAEAFSLQMSRLTGSAPFSERDLDRAWVAAQQAHQGLRFLPVLEKHLATFPEHSLNLESLKSRTTVSPDYLRWLTCHTAICDVEQPAALAYQGYLRMAVLRSAVALPRLSALACSPQAETEVESLFREAMMDSTRRKETLKLALVPPGDRLAGRTMSSLLRLRPDDRNLHFDVTQETIASVGHRQQSSPASLLWQEFLQRFPGDSEAEAALAKARLIERQRNSSSKPQTAAVR